MKTRRYRLVRICQMKFERTIIKCEYVNSYERLLAIAAALNVRPVDSELGYEVKFEVESY